MDVTDLRQLSRMCARSLAALRCAIGATALVRPAIAAKPWVGATESTRPSLRVFGRALGGRDVALGAGALLAASDVELSRIAALGALADGIDFLATVKDFKRLPRIGRLLVLGSTIGACTIGLTAAKVLSDEARALKTEVTA
jgi:hypothetical protein